MIELSDAVGMLGVAISIYCYGRVQWQRDYAKRTAYSVWNFISAALLCISLTDHWNLSAFACNAIWACISIYGIYRCLKYYWRARKAAVDAAKPLLDSAPRTL